MGWLSEMVGPAQRDLEAAQRFEPRVVDGFPKVAELVV